jgi:hypothetical protein
MSDPKCACPNADPHTCYFQRHAPMDDLQRVEFASEQLATGEECECPCHGDEYYGYDDEDYDDEY